MEGLTLIHSVEPRSAIHATKPKSNRTRALFEPLLSHQRILRQIVDARLGEWIGVKFLDFERS